MPRKKKTAMDMTTEELAKKVFPKKVRDKLKAVAHGKDGGFITERVIMALASPS